MTRVLVVDDEENIRDFVAEALELDGYEVTEAENGAIALEVLRRESMDVVVTDLKMPVMDGHELARAVQKDYPNIQVIVITAHGTVSSAVTAMKMGATDYLQKPIKLKELRRVVRDAAHRAPMTQEGSVAPGAAIGASAPDAKRTLSWGARGMKGTLRALERVAATPASVLLLGESGVGKEVFARAIHERSPRADKPFAALNCAAITESLIESELFGHEKGAFTGASARRIGVVEQADGGTVFLDEIGELKLELQAKLLRVLELQTFQRVGSSTSVSVNVRWIAATNRDLRAMVKGGSFRRDLYHRLATFPITIPPLRNRREDIAPLSNLLLAQIVEQSGSTPLELSEGAHGWLERQQWLGNIRELKNTLQRVAILAQSEIIDVDDFEFARSIEHYDGLDEDSLAEDAAAAKEFSTGLMTLDLGELEETAIRTALDKHEGNKRLAAEELGIPLRTLYNKVKRLGLD
ncbi:MAG: sigma-54 dependent transcriptional regulator [Myxococcota bacterium]